MKGSSSSRIIRADESVQVTTWRPGDLVGERPVPGKAGRPPASGRVEAPAPAPVPPLEPVRSAEEIHREELESLRESAREVGFAQGRAEGLARAADDMGRLQAIVSHLASLAEDLEQGIAEDVLSLSLELSRLMVRESLRVRPELILAVIREAARSFPELAEGPRLVLHPEDAALVREMQGVEQDPELASWLVVEDARLERGSCKLQTTSSEIDSTLENRWRRLVASLGRDDAWLDTNP
ncbi:MAG: FliH/SctL family protein [Betaproteobacteria bacterium]|jgi:flagellar assembly protein FliH